MNDKKSKTIYYVLSISAFILLAGYLILTFIPIFNISGDKINIYQVVQGYKNYKANAYMLISLIFTVIGISMVLIWPILALMQVNKKATLILSCTSLPLLAFGLINNLFIAPIYRSFNSVSKEIIKTELFPLILQNTLLILAILINISLIVFYAINSYKKKPEDTRGIHQ